MTAKQKPIRVLHVVGAMHRAGIETWLMHILRRTNREDVAMDFAPQSAAPAEYDDEIMALGSRLIPCTQPKQLASYVLRLIHTIKKYGPYDFVHSHVGNYSGLVLAAARFAGVPNRIAHSHSNLSSAQESANGMRKVYYQSSSALVKMFHTVGLAVSHEAASSLFGSNWQSRKSVSILHCGIDLTPYEQPTTRCTRAQFGIPDGFRVITHVGRFVPQKNHAFIVELAAKALERHPNIRFLLVGDGPLRDEIENLTLKFGVRQAFIFAGARADVSDILVNVSDAFIFPSNSEGLGLALVEAQAAGLPCLVSEAIPQEANVVPKLVNRLPLDASLDDWVTSLERVLFSQASITPQAAIDAVKTSDFNADVSWSSLMKVYKSI